jgi:hypothetical protein
MEQKSERLDLRAEKRVGVVASGRKGRRARLIHTGLPKGHGVSEPDCSIIRWRARLHSFRRGGSLHEQLDGSVFDRNRFRIWQKAIV